MNDETALDHFGKAVRHAAANVLMQLENQHRGWTTLGHDDPLVQPAMELATSEAKQRGVPADNCSVNSAHIVDAVHAMAGGGEAAAEVADATKAEAPRAQQSQARSASGSKLSSQT